MLCPYNKSWQRSKRGPDLRRQHFLCPGQHDRVWSHLQREISRPAPKRHGRSTEREGGLVVETIAKICAAFADLNLTGRGSRPRAPPPPARLISHDGYKLADLGANEMKRMRMARNEIPRCYLPFARFKFLRSG
ncbi:hypothetical protein EVAR_75944_1 [Eumeta japonica]|uniref:Uncharacterized protein n=1 Tax=Eumeta variegata TaxID=151549 RepID=A0A4C1UWW2_EUMVA|nr:hypothetical protein EVAR_75944_1 [Eumeta japonica]